MCPTNWAQMADRMLSPSQCLLWSLCRHVKRLVMKQWPSRGISTTWRRCVQKCSPSESQGTNVLKWGIGLRFRLSWYRFWGENIFKVTVTVYSVNYDNITVNCKYLVLSGWADSSSVLFASLRLCKLKEMI